MTGRARRDGRAARRNEERGKREDEKGAIVSSSPQGMTSWSSSIKICFFKLIECIKMSWCETECKNVCHW